MFDFLKRRRRDALRAQPFPEAWREILDRDVAYAAKLGKADRAELEGLIQIFLAEKNLEGCGGLELTDEIRVTIAAHACLLLLHRPARYYPRLVSVIVYPHAYVADHVEYDEDGVTTEGAEERLGESWDRGVVVLSWDDVQAAARGADGCRNVVLHEFAHQLDSEDGTVEGSPALGHPSEYDAWARILGREYERLQEAAESGRPSILDEYGATSPAEFFAVATECFFTRPTLLLVKHPELYRELTVYYQQDPARLS